MPSWGQFIGSLGKGVESSEFTTLISSIEEKPIITNDPDEYDDLDGGTKYYSYPKSGVLMGIRVGVLDHVHLYIEGHEGYQPYKGEVPKNIDLEANEQKIITIFGIPERSGGGNFDALLGYLYRWVRYDFISHKVRFEFSQENKLREMTLMRSI